jgi:hypothetical protein
MGFMMSHFNGQSPAFLEFMGCDFCLANMITEDAESEEEESSGEVAEIVDEQDPEPVKSSAEKDSESGIEHLEGAWYKKLPQRKGGTWEDWYKKLLQRKRGT